MNYLKNKGETSMRKYLVVYSTIDKSTEITDITDHYEVFENMKDAKEEYKKILDYDDLYTASITQVLESTDYES
jgi:hypothetical protein